MRKIILWMGVSLDGFIEAPGRDISWHRVDEELHTYFNDELRKMGGFLGGRVTHELMAEFWPTADADPENAGPTADFAEIWRDMPKVVYSRTLDHAEWNTTIVREVVPDEVRELKEQPGGDMVLGGAHLAATFIRLGLVDEYRIFFHPVVVGGGTPLFAGGEHLDLELVDTRRFGNGVVEVRYVPA